MANPNRIAGGLKATIHNPHTSEEAKDHAAARLEDMGFEVEGREHDTREEKADDEHEHRRLGGYKASLSNPNTSEAARQHAREVLDAGGHEKNGDEIRVLAGYKAALHNPRVSAEAKTHARDYLDEHGAEY